MASHGFTWLDGISLLQFLGFTSALWCGQGWSPICCSKAQLITLQLRSNLTSEDLPQKFDRWRIHLPRPDASGGENGQAPLAPLSVPAAPAASSPRVSSSPQMSSEVETIGETGITVLFFVFFVLESESLCVTSVRASQHLTVWDLASARLNLISTRVACWLVVR